MHLIQALHWQVFFVSVTTHALINSELHKITLEPFQCQYGTYAILVMTTTWLLGKTNSVPASFARKLKA
jgi:hypothetical protein